VLFQNSSICPNSRALNIKKIPYKTTWLDFTELVKIGEHEGIKPLPGPAPYTVPAIYDPNTGKAFMDSQKIHEYLEEQYPDTHKLYPPGTRALQAAWVGSITPRMTVQLLIPTVILVICSKASESGVKYLRDTRREMVGLELEQIAPKDDADLDARVKKWEALLKEAASYIDAGEGPFIGGASPINADLDMAAALTFCKRAGGLDHPVTKLAMSVDGGRWAKYLAPFEEKWSEQH
jgi:glutathione S-transferase